VADYLKERMDLHKAANVWPLLGNLLKEEELDAVAFVGEDRTNGTDGTDKAGGRRGARKEESYVA